MAQIIGIIPLLLVCSGFGGVRVEFHLSTHSLTGFIQHSLFLEDGSRKYHQSVKLVKKSQIVLIGWILDNWLWHSIGHFIV